MRFNRAFCERRLTDTDPADAIHSKALCVVSDMLSVVNYLYRGQ